MNLWFVAYYIPSGTYGGKDVRRLGLIYLPEEANLLSATPTKPASDRTYSCLVKWRADDQSTPLMSISNLRFNPFDEARAVMLDKEIVKEKEEERIKTEDITDEIEFAAFGQQVIRNGEITDLGTIAQQFSDVRHLFKLPNLGDVSQIKKEVGKVVGGALWFGENQLIRIQDWDRRRGALSRPVELDWSYIRQREGFQKRSTEEWRRIVAEAFRLKGYRRIERDERPPQEPGEFRFDPANTNLVDCSTSFLRNGYA